MSTSSQSSTPDQLRRWSLVVAVLAVAFAVLGALAARGSVAAMAAIRDNTGPVLVQTQSLLASLAEADAAAAADFVQGGVDPRPRRAYLDALARTAEQLEAVSALIGDDPEAHEALGDLGIGLNRYAGLVEAARAAGQLEPTAGALYLAEAGELLAGDIDAAAAQLEEASQARVDQDASRSSLGGWLVVAIGAGALLVLAVAQRWLTGRTNRVLNLPLVASTVLIGVTVVWLGAGLARSQARFDRALDLGYDSIVLTSDVQAGAFGSLRDELSGLIVGTPLTGSGSAATDADGATDIDADALIGQLADVADSDREVAAVGDLQVRWARYAAAVDGFRARPTVDRVGELVSTFNGFIFTTEGILADNRDQFLSGLDDAADALSGLSLATLVLPLLAAAAALGGFQIRINEYR